MIRKYLRAPCRDFFEVYNLLMKKVELEIPERNSEEEDNLAQQRAEDEGMVQHEWSDEELAEILAEDLLNGSTPG